MKRKFLPWIILIATVLLSVSCSLFYRPAKIGTASLTKVSQRSRRGNLLTPQKNKRAGTLM